MKIIHHDFYMKKTGMEAHYIYLRETDKGYGQVKHHLPQALKRCVQYLRLLTEILEIYECYSSCILVLHNILNNSGCLIVQKMQTIL